MSLDPSAFPRSNSPASSDSSLTRPRVRGKEETLRKDKNYRRYASSIERALSLFDTALQEWADYISFLSRLLKALQSHPPDLPIVPHKTIVAKRLAQCLNPSLPSGVHQKALEVYTYIFSLIKPEGLSHDLVLYLPGIAPTLTFASLSVRPLFLSLVETFLPDLEPWAIRPALKAIILALLPGLEEETSDDFETTLRIVNKFRNVSSQMRTQRPSDHADASGQYFWQCLFLASITNPSRRMGVLAYLNRHLPKLGMTDHKNIISEQENAEIPEELLAAAESVISPEPGLLIRCFATGLADDQLLVQRNFLDLLVTHLPLHSPILQSRITRADLQTLVIAAAGVVTRRDMSLNRRLWAWFLGPDPTSSGNERTSLESPKDTSEITRPSTADSQDYSQSQYFGRFGLESLVKGILEMVQHQSVVPSERTRPLRISLSLMDRWEVGGSVVPEVFLPIMRSIQDYENLVPQNQFEEVFRSASAFFDGVESSLIFSELLSLIDFKLADLDTATDEVSRNLSLAIFIIENFNIREEEMLLIHIPLLVLSLVVKMDELSGRTDGVPGTRRAVSSQLLQIVNECIGLLSERALSRKAASEKTNGSQTPVAEITPEDILARIHSFYDKSKDALDLPPLPLPPKVVGELILRESHQLSMSVLEGNDSSLTVKESLNLFVALLKKVPKSRILRDGRLYNAINSRLTSSEVQLTSTVFAAISSIVSATTSLYTTHTIGLHMTYEQISHLVPILVHQLWMFLSPSSPKFHVEAVRSLWLLHSVSWPDHLVEASVTHLMVQSSSQSCHGSTATEAENFFVLWNHSHHANYELPLLRVTEELSAAGKSTGHDRASYQSSLLERPLFIVLDLLSHGLNEASQIVHEWLQELGSIHKVFRMTISRLERLFTLELKGRNDSTRLTVSPDHYKECHYLFRTVSNILVTLSHNGWISLLTHSVTPVDKRYDPSSSEDQQDRISLHHAIFNAALSVVELRDSTSHMSTEEEKLQQIVLLVLRQLLVGPGAERIIESNIIEVLIERLSLALDQNSSVTQRAAMDTLLAALKIKFFHAAQPAPPPPSKHKRAGSRDTLTSASLLSLSTDRVDKVQPAPIFPQPPPQLLDCLLKGISSSKSHESVDKWVVLLCECLPLYHGTIFQILLMLVECFCREIRSSYNNLQQVFKKTAHWSNDSSEHVIVALLTGLETCLATAHERLLLEEANAPSVKSPDQSQGFFGNMVSGVFTSEGNPTRSAAANNRLTVLLCFQDAVRLCFSIWAWGASGKNGVAQDTESVASFQYTSLRMRNRSRRILEHLFTAEALECLETLVEMWSKSATTEANAHALIFNLLHTLDGSRPKITIPAIFNAIYSRTNPSAIDPSRKSAMTLNITEADLAAFLVTYARSLDDDVLDEIWSDCITFLRDVLANPFPHRQILPRLVEFAAILGAKMENTNFGEDRRMRKDLGDLLLRLLTAIFTSKPLGLSQEAALSSRSSLDDNSSPTQIGPDDVLSILALSMPAFITTLGESDRIGSAMTSVSTNVIGPLLRSRLFPNNMNKNVLSLFQDMSKVPAASKSWRKDIADAFNDPRFFGSQIEIVKTGWMILLRQWIIVDKDRLSELLGRLTPPTSAGIMFGVGASAARLEADRKAQLNLRRIALLILSADEDHFVTEFPALLQKIEDLLAATNVSSPSSATRSEIFMVLRSLVLKTSTTHLAPFWPLINTELHEAISSIAQEQPPDFYNPYSLLQACKLLDVLILTAPDDFQLQEWLFVTDTIDAVYPPHRWEPTALADEVSQVLGSRGAASPTVQGENSDVLKGLKRPALNSDQIRETAKDEIVDRVLRPFFDRLSIHAFESTYSMGAPDLETCKDDLLADLFNESTMAN
ncbi:protein dopey [Paecilomyces variotii No. 5]|uniref:Protein dopey n=1 Tax=Byssochlamys spectabilis (strain No. 5 / NBRC 109023) TaxID=1356009 RepID=V5FAU9_BYSSN|nr:protein dopey [Paecilomyces variotii No. 5]